MLSKERSISIIAGAGCFLLLAQKSHIMSSINLYRDNDEGS